MNLTAVRTQPRRLARTIHRLSGTVLAAYSLVHIVNHLASLRGVEAHIELMSKLRTVYRNPVVETILLLAVAIQIASGVAQLWWSRMQKVGLLVRLQRLAGLCLLLFLFQHISAILFGRYVQHLDTNFYFASRVVLQKPHLFYFAPYYFAGVLALGSAVALLIVLSLAGAFFSIQLPPEYY